MMSRKLLISVLFSFCSLLLSAQATQTDYDKAWLKTDSLLSKKGLTQSALQEVAIIYTRAKKEKNDGQLIKALIYRMNLLEKTQEDAPQDNIKSIEQEIKISQDPAKSILQSILAEMYNNFFQQNRYKIYSRTNTAQYNNADIATWSSDQFHKKISTSFLTSISNEQLLQQTKPANFDAVIVKGNSRYLRPTLFDLLAHRALDYFKNDERDISRPAYAFEINSKEAFADKAIFSHHLFPNTDSTSMQYKALRLFQQLLIFHAQDEKPDALVDADIERLAFVNQYSILENKEELYRQALENITNHYGSLPTAAQAWYLQASILRAKGEGYNPPWDTANSEAYRKARSICEKVILQKDSSEGKSNCLALLKDIDRKELTLQTEKVNTPEQPFRTLVSYRNFSELYFRIVKVDHRFKETLGNNEWRDGYWEKVLHLPVLKTFSQLLPQKSDYQKHSAEIKIDALPVGEYALLASVNNDFSLSKNLLALQYFYVSNIAFINNGEDYFVLNRDNGQPLPGVSVQVWNQFYDYKTLTYSITKGGNYSPDLHGYFLLREKEKDNKANGQLLEYTSTGDHLFLDEQADVFQVRDDDDSAKTLVQATYEKDNLKTFLFMDRSIYRPGQTTWFKGIVITKDLTTGQSKIVPHFKTTVFLYDANTEKIDSLQVVTNDFGSYNGKFRLPENLLNGVFKITDDSTGNEQSFSVEEYKRPKFVVEFEKQKGTYRLNDSIPVTGSVNAYAGNAIDGATVKYRVVRHSGGFPHMWSLFGSRGMDRSKTQEISHGETKTDGDGKFTLRFSAIPDHSIEKDTDPVFEYEVIADVTDINGESRSGDTRIPVGYKTMMLSIDVPHKNNLSADSLRQLFIKTTNMAGEFEPATVQVVISSLKSPDRLIRQRYWQQPDQFTMTKDDYLKYFPFDEYSNETQKNTWASTAKLFETGVVSTKDGFIAIKNTSFTAGWYKIEATIKDKNGEAIKDISYIQLFNTKTGEPASPLYNWANGESKSAEPGEKATIAIGSSAAALFVIQRIDRPDNTTTGRTLHPGFSFFTLNKERKEIAFPVAENDRGGFGVSFCFIKNNRFYTSNDTIAVPWTNKALQVGYTTYRDKTLPGSQEKWTIHLSGYKRDKVAAEALAAMYDASLDQFKPHSWDVPDIYPYYNDADAWQARNNFAQALSSAKNTTDSYDPVYEKSYDMLFSINNPVNIRIRGMSSFAAGANYGAPRMKNASNLNEVVVTALGASKRTDLKLDADYSKVQQSKSPQQNESPAPVRKNFAETAFFLPDLKTDSMGNISFSFTMPEALTKWKWMTLSHTKDLAFGYGERTIVTQKQLMVQPNLPRFLREGDHVELSTKIVNLTDSELTGQVELQLLDATTNEPVDGWFINMQANQYFTVAAHQSEAVSFPLQVPFLFNKPVTYRIIAKAPLKSKQNEGPAEIGDGEEATLPILSNRMLVTESIPINMQRGGTKNFNFDKLLQSSNSETLNHHALVFEFTSNPVWYAVQALPYLMEFPYECAEQTFNRYYANTLASKLVNSSARIKEVFEKWKVADTAAFISNLQKNQELKSVLLQETPWVLDAKTETGQKKAIALLFDMARMSGESTVALAKLVDMQLPNGAFSWFKGGSDDRYITQYILTGIGHLKKLGALPSGLTEKLNGIIKAALPYLDDKIAEDYARLAKQDQQTTKQRPGQLNEIAIQYLYMRSFYSDYALPGKSFPAVNFYRKQTQQYWINQNKYMQGMIALALYRTGDVQKAKDIIASLKQNAIVNEELGMYWKDMTPGYAWYQAPTETQSLMIEAFQEIGKDDKMVNNLKTWLLKQKQTQHWTTTKATADACYALLLQGADWTGNTPAVQISAGGKAISTGQSEAGTGYFKTTIDGTFVKPEMGNISVTISPSPNQKTALPPSWGAVYWQYFEDLDKITTSATPLHVTKKLFVQTNTDHGLLLEPVAENGVLHPGDKVIVRIELKADRDMEYIQLKDMRASCMEPVHVISGYTWQGGLGYYETTKDASTSFFFNRLPRGTYVFEYPVFVGSKGNFSNGITNVQCMYAPEFSAHSEGIRVNVE